MKTRQLVVGVILMSVARPAVAGLDFTLHHKATVSDAIAVDQIYLTDGPSKIYLHASPDWKMTGTPDGIECIPDVPDARVRLATFTGPNPLTIDADGGLALVQRVTSQLPQDAKNVVAMPVDLNTMPIFNWATMEVTVTYELFGQKMLRSLMYVGMLPGRIAELSVITLEPDFAKVHKQARQMLSSWFEPSRDLPPDLQRKYESPGTPGG